MDNDKTTIAIKPGEITILTLESKNGLNLLQRQTFQELYDILETLQAEPNLKVLIIEGQGTKCFSAGADIKELLHKDLEIKGYVSLGEKLMQSIFEFPVPVIASINGYALGAGFSLALACEFRYIATTAKMGQVAVKNGLIPPFGNIQHLIQTIGYNQTKELIYTGKTLNAEEALSKGLVNKICSAESLQTAVLQFAQEIAANSSYVVQKLKKIVNGTLYGGFERGYKLQRAALVDCLHHPATRKKLTEFFNNSLP